MDNYIHKAKQIITNADIHLIGLVSIFIASKMEDIVPLRMSHMITSLGSNKFTVKEIKQQELNILKVLDFDYIFISSYDFAKTYIYDFFYNNKAKIDKLKMHKLIDKIDWTTYYLCKLIIHSHEFTGYK
jgi:cyclin B